MSQQQATTPQQLAASLAALIHGPYADTSTAGAAALLAEAARYLNYAAPYGGITEPAAVAAVAADLSIAAGRLPQLLSALAGWLQAENAAGRIADDRQRPPADRTALTCAALTQAAGTADHLATALSNAHNLASTLCAAGTPAGQPGRAEATA